MQTYPSQNTYLLIQTPESDKQKNNQTFGMQVQKIMEQWKEQTIPEFMLFPCLGECKDIPSIK